METNEDKKCLNLALDLCSNYCVKTIIMKERFDNVSLDEWPWGEHEKEILLNIMNEWPVAFDLRERVYNLIVEIGMKLLRWTEYNYYIFGLPYEQSRNVIRRSLFTANGTIDQEGAAMVLVIDENISFLTRFKIASTFNIKSIILPLYCGIPDFIKDKINQLNFNEPFIPLLTKSWLNIWNGRLTLAQYAQEMFEISIITGSCTVIKNLIRDYKYLNEDIRFFFFGYVLSRLDPEGEWISDSLKFERKWIPKENYINLFLHVFANANEFEIIELFMYAEEKICLLLLKGLLEWPYQIHFFEYSKYMWNTITEHGFVEVLLCILTKIQKNDDHIYNYRLIFKQFWLEASDEIKKCACTRNPNYSFSILVESFKIFPLRDSDIINIKLVLEHINPDDFLGMKASITSILGAEGGSASVCNFQNFCGDL